MNNETTTILHYLCVSSKQHQHLTIRCCEAEACSDAAQAPNRPQTPRHPIVLQVGRTELPPRDPALIWIWPLRWGPRWRCEVTTAGQTSASLWAVCAAWWLICTGWFYCQFSKGSGPPRGSERLAVAALLLFPAVHGADARLVLISADFTSWLDPTGIYFWFIEQRHKQQRLSGQEGEPQH